MFKRCFSRTYYVLQTLAHAHTQTNQGPIPEVRARRGTRVTCRCISALLAWMKNGHKRKNHPALNLLTVNKPRGKWGSLDATHRGTHHEDKTERGRGRERGQGFIHIAAEVTKWSEKILTTCESIVKTTRNAW